MESSLKFIGQNFRTKKSVSKRKEQFRLEKNYISKIIHINTKLKIKLIVCCRCGPYLCSWGHRSFRSRRANKVVKWKTGLIDFRHRLYHNSKQNSVSVTDMRGCVIYYEITYSSLDETLVRIDSKVQTKMPCDWMKSVYRN